MYCGSCGRDCIVPETHEGVPGLGCTINKKTEEVKVIRCVECANRIGTDVKTIHICIRKDS